jgi:preprotein translocase subunit Sss1
MMKKYKKKPIIIEAIIWNGNNLKEIITFTGLHNSAKKWTWEEYEQIVKKEGLKIFTLEGSLKASIGDYIIKGIKGECYPCKPDIFKATYESIEEA